MRYEPNSEEWLRDHEYARRYWNLALWYPMRSKHRQRLRRIRDYKTLWLLVDGGTFETIARTIETENGCEYGTCRKQVQWKFVFKEIQKPLRLCGEHARLYDRVWGERGKKGYLVVTS